MSSANLGSIAVNVLARFPDCTAGVSGNLLALVDEQRIYMEERTGLSIGSVGIAERFQPALTSLSMAAAMNMSRIDGVNAASLRLGDFSVDKNGDDNLGAAAKAMQQLAEEQLRRIGRGARFTRVIGG